MWLREVEQKQYKTYSLAGTGTQCSNREFSTIGASENGLQAYVDPFIEHPQITTYQHPLDMWSNMDFQSGRVCKYGTSLLERNGDFATTFEKIVGHSGSQMLLDKPIKDYAYQSRYWGHSLHYMLLVMKDPTVLKEDGTTDGGCAQAAIQPEGSLECPTHEANKGCVVAGAVLAAVALESLPGRRRRRNKTRCLPKGPHKTFSAKQA